MKNLKKLLAVVLAVVMVFSAMSITASAFSDDADIEYKEAVGIMTGIGAINGYPDGTFDPTGLVTRAEAAKMICFAKLGPAMAEGLPMGPAVFDDVPASHWANKYVYYCYTQGIVDGMDEDTFNPEGNVTGLQLAKMILVAIGYGEMDEFVGIDWAYNTYIAANQNDIFMGNEDLDVDAAATREEAALYILNGLMAEMVYYSELLGRYVGMEQNIFEMYGDLDNDVEIVVKNQATSEDDMTYIWDGGLVGYDIETGLDMIGHEMNFIYNDDEDDEVYFWEDIDSTMAYTVGDTLPTGVQIDGDFKVFVNYAYDGMASELPAKDGTIVYNTETGDIVSFLYEEFYVDVVSTDGIDDTDGEESITLDGAGELQNNEDSDVVTAYDGIAAGDVVIVTMVGDFYMLEEAATITGMITKTAGTTITVGGVAYAPTAAASDNSGLTSDTFDFTSNFMLYLDGMGGYIAAVKQTEDTSVDAGLFYAVYTYEIPASSYIDAYGEEQTDPATYYAQGVNMAGEEVVFQISEATYEDGEGAKDETVYPVLYTVATDSETGISALTEAGEAFTNDESINATTVKIDDDAYYAADVMTLYVDGNMADLEVTVVDGKPVLADDDTGYYYLNTAGDVAYVIVDTTAPEDVTPVTGDIIYVTDAATTASTADGDYYDVYIDGEAKNIYVSNADGTVVPTEDTFYTYYMDGDMYVLSATTTGVFSADEITTLYGTLITTTPADVEDAEAAGAMVVDTTGGDIDTVAELSEGDVVALQLNSDGDIVIVYYTDIVLD